MLTDNDFPVRPDESIKFYEPNAHFHYLTYLCNHSSISNPWDGYALAYLHAAKFVFRGIQEGDPELPNTIGYSFFFLYRHYLELRIKELIRSGHAFFDEPAPKVTQREHNLNKLWNDHCKRLLGRIAEIEVGYIPPETQEHFNIVSFYLAQTMAYDPNSDAFRYPIDNKGNPHFSDSKVKTLNTYNFENVMDWISFYLEGESTRIYELTQQKFEKIMDDHRNSSMY